MSASEPPALPRPRQRKRSAKAFVIRRRLWAAIGGAALLVGGITGHATTQAMKRQGASLTAPLSFPWMPDYEKESRLSLEVDRGRSWAAMAYLAGLRNCPDPSPSFLQGCQARMAEEAAAERAMAQWRAEDLPHTAAMEPHDQWDVEYSQPVVDEPSWSDLRQDAVARLQQREPGCAPCASDAILPDPSLGRPPQAEATAQPAPPAWRSLATAAEPASEGDPIMMSTASEPVVIQ